MRFDQTAPLTGWVGVQASAADHDRVGRRAWIPAELKKRAFTLSEAEALGVSRRALEGQSWRRLGRGFYCWAGLKEDPWRLLVAWRKRLPPTAVFIGLTAAWLHRLDVDPIHPIEVVAAGVRSRAGLLVRQCSLEPSDVAQVRGLPATTVARTLRDLKRRLEPVEHLVLADAALRLGLGRHDEFAEPAGSPMETRLRWLLLKAGLPRPLVEVDLRDAENRFLGRADLYYPQARLIIEFDGANHRDRMTEDRRRQNAILSAGYQLLRFTSADLYQRPGAIVGQVRGAL